MPTDDFLAKQSYMHSVCSSSYLLFCGDAGVALVWCQVLNHVMFVK